MIVFYKKNSGQIFSVVEGRVHDDPEKMMVQVSGVEPENIGKYIIPYKQKIKEYPHIYHHMGGYLMVFVIH